MNGAEAVRDWIEIALICASILGTAGVAIHRMTRMIVVMSEGFKQNSKEHEDIRKIQDVSLEVQKCHSRLITRHDKDIALLTQHCKGDDLNVP